MPETLTESGTPANGLKRISASDGKAQNLMIPTGVSKSEIPTSQKDRVTNNTQ